MAIKSKTVDLFYVLPEECIASVLSFTSPQDACRSSSVSTNFRSAADSDAVWESFLPPQYKRIISRSADSSSFCFSSKKELYRRLCDHPLLLDEGRKSFWLEKRSGKICDMLSPKDLVIVWMETSKYWRWTSLPDARFPEVAELMGVCWVEIHGKINTCMLSPTTVYTAFLVFKVSTGSYGFENQPVKVAVGVVGSEGQKRKSVYLNPERGLRRPLSQIVWRRVGPYNHTHILYQPLGLGLERRMTSVQKREEMDGGRTSWVSSLMGEKMTAGKWK